MNDETRWKCNMYFTNGETLCLMRSRFGEWEDERFYAASQMTKDDPLKTRYFDREF